MRADRPTGWPRRLRDSGDAGRLADRETDGSGSRMKIGITCYPTYGGSGAVATELGLELARRGHEVHFITYDSPFRLRGYAERVYFHEVETTMGRYPLFEHYPYTLALASKQHEVALREKLDILHVHYAIPHATTAFLAREMLRPEHATQGDHDAPRHRHHAGRAGVELLRHHQVLDRAVRRGDRGVGVPARRDLSRLRLRELRPAGDPQLRQPGGVPPRSRTETEAARPGGPQAHHPHLQLPRGEAGQGRDPGLRPDPAGHAGDPGDDRRRPRAGRRGERGAASCRWRTTCAFSAGSTR